MTAPALPTPGVPRNVDDALRALVDASHAYGYIQACEGARPGDKVQSILNAQHVLAAKNKAARTAILAFASSQGGEAVTLLRRVASNQWEHRCSDKVGGCTAVSASTMADVEEFVKALPRAAPVAGAKQEESK